MTFGDSRERHNESTTASVVYSLRRQPSSAPSARPPAVLPRVACVLHRARPVPCALLAACAHVAPAGRCRAAVVRREVAPPR